MDIPVMVQFVRAQMAELEKEAQQFPKGRTARLVIKTEIRRLSEMIEPLVKDRLRVLRAPRVDRSDPVSQKTTRAVGRGLAAGQVAS